MKKQKKLSLTVGITTCYGDESILDTVKSILESEGIGKFRFIIIADRVPISEKIKKVLQKNDVELIENKNESSQIVKQKQILAMTTSDIIILTQDDVLYDKGDLAKIVKAFEKDDNLTMVSVRNQPVKPTNFFEAILNTGTNINNRIAKIWRKGDNYLTVIGRCMAFKTSFIKQKFRMPDNVATTDAYYYFENKKNKGKYKFLPDVPVYFKNPQNLTEHMRKSSRFQYSQLEMSHYFPHLEKEYIKPTNIVMYAMIQEFLSNPIFFVLYLGVYIYTRMKKLTPSYVLNAVWEVDSSTKKVLK